jgi:hypothetical protein
MQVTNFYFLLAGLTDTDNNYYQSKMSIYFV